MRTKTKPMGRPPKEKPQNKAAAFSTTLMESYEIRTAAAAAGLSVSAYLRRKLGLDKEVEG